VEDESQKEALSRLAELLTSLKEEFIWTGDDWNKWEDPFVNIWKAGTFRDLDIECGLLDEYDRFEAESTDVQPNWEENVESLPDLNWDHIHWVWKKKFDEVVRYVDKTDKPNLLWKAQQRVSALYKEAREVIEENGKKRYRPTGQGLGGHFARLAHNMISLKLIRLGIIQPEALENHRFMKLWLEREWKTENNHKELSECQTVKEALDWEQNSPDDIIAGTQWVSMNEAITPDNSSMWDLKHEISFREVCQYRDLAPNLVFRMSTEEVLSWQQGLFTEESNSREAQAELARVFGE
jgi:hypothetical protein